MNRMIHHAVYKPKTLVFENTDLFVVHMLQTLIYQKGSCSPLVRLSKPS